MIYDFGPEPDNQTPHQSNPDMRSEVEQTESLTQLHSPASRDITTADRIARNAVNNSGARVMVHVRTDNADYDEELEEDADPTYYGPVELRCIFTPQPTEVELKKWGAESDNTSEVIFSMSQLVERWPGRLVRPGDVLELPYNHPIPSLDPGYYEVVSATPQGNFRYHWLYYSCTIRVLPADHTVRVRDDMGAI